MIDLVGGRERAVVTGGRTWLDVAVGDLKLGTPIFAESDWTAGSRGCRNERCAKPFQPSRCSAIVGLDNDATRILQPSQGGMVPHPGKLGTRVRRGSPRNPRAANRPERHGVRMCVCSRVGCLPVPSSARGAEGVRTFDHTTQPAPMASVTPLRSCEGV